nr:uncharacterized protein LOC127316284 [Lolium perenne]
MRRSTPSWSRVAAAAAAEDSNSDISWSSDDPDAPTSEERATEQRAIVESFEMLQDLAANARLDQTSSSDEEFDDDNTDDLLDPIRDAKFLADAEKEAEEERAAHAAFDAEMECRRVAAAAEDDDSDIPWFSDDPDAPTPEEKAAEQRALVDYFETLKKDEDAANETLRLRLLEDAVAHRALAVTRQVAEKQMREGRNDGVRPSCSK